MDIVAGQECSAAILCDDIMTEILVRLPPESIFMYRSVSKQWNSLLTSPDFLSHYARCFHHKQRIGSPHHLLGFFQNKLLCFPGRLSFLSTLPRIGHRQDPKHGKSFPPDLDNFITSSNGLVLCGCYDKKSFHVLNPVTRKHVSLPPPSKYHKYLSIGLSCDDDSDDLTPRYEVVIADLPWNSGIDNKLCIETYSSETKEWRESVLVSTSDFRVVGFCPPTVVNGVFYWWALDCLAVYDPHNKQRGNKDRNHVQVIQLPTTPETDWLVPRVFNQTPDGRLIYGTTCNKLIEIWELPKRELGFWRATTITEQEWVSIHVVSTQTLCPRNPFIRNEQREQWMIKLYEEEMGICGFFSFFRRNRFVLVDFIPWNPLLLMVRLGRSIFLYHMETQVLERIVCLLEYHDEGHPFFEPTSFSSYFLA